MKPSGGDSLFQPSSGGDLEGNLIFLSTDKGAAQLRVSTDGSPLAAAPVVSGMTLLAVTQNGGLFALRP